MSCYGGNLSFLLSMKEYPLRPSTTITYLTCCFCLFGLGARLSSLCVNSRSNAFGSFNLYPIGVKGVDLHVISTIIKRNHCIHMDVFERVWTLPSFIIGFFWGHCCCLFSAVVFHEVSFYLHKVYAIIKLLFIFVRKLFKANIAVTKDVLRT